EIRAVAASAETQRMTLPARQFPPRPPVRLRFCAVRLANSKLPMKPQPAQQESTKDDPRSSDSSFEIVEAVDVSCGVVSIDSNNQGETNCGFSGCDSDCEN